jgi:uroporphyrinogen decarboxylase
MTSHERVILAINHQTPDRIPIDFWATAGMVGKLEAGLGRSHSQFLDDSDVDLRYIAGPRYVGPPLVSERAGETVDIWGVPRRVVEVAVPGGVERYAEVVRAPLAEARTAEDVLSYHHWPSPDWFDYSVVEGQCDDVLRQGRAVAFMGDRLSRVSQMKPAMYLRGDEPFMIDLAMDPEVARAIIGKVRQFYLGYLERVFGAAKGKIDILVSGDDFGTQRGLWVSAAMWDEFIRDGFAAYNSVVKSHGVKTMHHTCGAVSELIPRLIECGLDVLQSVQPEARGMSIDELKAKYGARLAFQGGVSVQKTLPFGSSQEIREEVKHLAEVAGKGGGYIFGTAHNIQADTPVANVVALMQAYHEYGVYR